MPKATSKHHPVYWTASRAFATVFLVMLLTASAVTPASAGTHRSLPGARVKPNPRRNRRRRHSPTARAAVIGGSVAAEGSFPWMAYIAFESEEAGERCSGTVVAPRLVLTAGHCAESTETGSINEPSTYRVVTGNADWADEADRQVLDVSKVIVYPDFNRNSLTDDAALLELSTPTTAPAIGLATNLGGMPAGTAAIIAGWGTTFYEQEYATERLRWAETAVQGPSYCNEHAQPFDGQDELCVIDPPSYSTGACHGDSGGPLLAEWPEGQGVVEIGITSHIYGECSTDEPSVFTRSDLVASWVKSWAERIHSEEEAAAIAKRKQEEEIAAKKRHEEEVAAAKKRQEEELAASAKRKQEEEAAVKAAKTHQEEEAATKDQGTGPKSTDASASASGAYRGTANQEKSYLALIVSHNSKNVVAFTATLTYHCQAGRSVTSTVSALSPSDATPLDRSRTFQLHLSGGGDTAKIKGSVDAQTGMASGTIAATYDKCATGQLSWTAQRSAALAASTAIAVPGAYHGPTGKGPIHLTVGPSGRDLTSLTFTAQYSCPYHLRIHRTESFLSTQDVLPLAEAGTFTTGLTGANLSGTIAGQVGLKEGEAVGTLSVSIRTRYGRCSTGTLYWSADRREQQ
jgi:hypothetical protein